MSVDDYTEHKLSRKRREVDVKLVSFFVVYFYLAEINFASSRHYTKKIGTSVDRSMNSTFWHVTSVQELLSMVNIWTRWSFCSLVWPGLTYRPNQAERFWWLFESIILYNSLFTYWVNTIDSFSVICLIYFHQIMK